MVEILEQGGLIESRVVEVDELLRLMDCVRVGRGLAESCSRVIEEWNDRTLLGDRGSDYEDGKNR